MIEVKDKVENDGEDGKGYIQRIFLKISFKIALYKAITLYKHAKATMKVCGVGWGW